MFFRQPLIIEGDNAKISQFIMPLSVVMLSVVMLSVVVPLGYSRSLHYAKSMHAVATTFTMLQP